jgi:DICT domain-containing protein
MKFLLPLLLTLSGCVAESKADDTQVWVYKVTNLQYGLYKVTYGKTVC